MDMKFKASVTENDDLEQEGKGVLIVVDLKPQVKWAAIEATVCSQPDMARDLIERTPRADGDSL